MLSTIPLLTQTTGWLIDCLAWGIVWDSPAGGESAAGVLCHRLWLLLLLWFLDNLLLSSFDAAVEVPKEDLLSFWTVNGSNCLFLTKRYILYILSCISIIIYI